MQKTTEFCNNQKNMIFITEVRLRKTFMTQDVLKQHILL